MSQTNPKIINQDPVSIANLRHDLRTPINAIIGYSEMLIEDLAEEDDSDLRYELETIQVEGNKLLSIINKILEPRTKTQSYSSLDLSNISDVIIMEAFSPLDVIISSCQLLLAKTKQSELGADIERIQTSAKRLQTLLENLIHPSVKSEEDNQGKLSASNLVKVDNNNTLAEKQHISSFVLHHGHILVVDDNENNLDLLSRQLQKEGYTVTTAPDGQQALQMIATEAYDLILLDLLMPGLNGYQVLERLKSEPQWQGIPVIMISASDELDNVVNCIEIGAEDYLPKPFNSTLLKARIGASLEKKRLRDRERKYLQQVEEYSRKLNQELEIGRKAQQNSLSTQKQISLAVSVEEIKFKPGYTTPSFEINVTNQSDRFVSFMIEIIPAGVKEQRQFYQLSPEVSTKTPPGAVSKFIVTILNNPQPGFAGMMNLTVKAFCLEINTEAREIVRLIIEPGLDMPALQLQLTESELQAYPDNQITIPARIYNPNKTPIEASISLSGLAFDWFEDGLDQKISLMPKRWTETKWIAQIPHFDHAIARKHNFSIQGRYENSAEAMAKGSLEILPVGETSLKCTPEQHRLPRKRPWLPNWLSPPVIYHLSVENLSNLLQKVNINIQQEEKNKCELELNPFEQSVSPNQTVNFDLQVTQKRPWIGWGKEIFLDIEMILSDLRLEDSKNQQTVSLKLLPIIPRWLQSTVGLLLFAGLIWWLEIPANFLGSETRIYSVRFNGITDEVVAGSSDRLIYRWSRAKNQLKSRKIVAQTEKPVRTLRYRPLDNDRLAAGLENGEILILNLLSNTQQPIYNFTYQKDDRVLSLAYTLDARHLFSAHGSGLVLQWYVGDEIIYSLNRAEPTLKKQFDFAIYDLALVGENRNILAVAGRFNQLLVWNFSKDIIIPLPYQQGGQSDYINSIASPAQRPFWLAVADNQGAISLWNIESCLRGSKECEIIDSWEHGATDTPIQSIAFSDNGCYLASAGDDGKVKLWSLTASGKRETKYIEGITLASVSRKINSLDLAIADDRILIITGEDNGKVNLHQSKLVNKECL